jgi:hypothetical protein
MEVIRQTRPHGLGEQMAEQQDAANENSAATKNILRNLT